MSVARVFPIAGVTEIARADAGGPAISSTATHSWVDVQETLETNPVDGALTHRSSAGHVSTPELSGIRA